MRTDPVRNAVLALAGSLGLALPAGAGGIADGAARIEREVGALRGAVGDRLGGLPVVGGLLGRVHLSGDTVGVFLDAGSGSQLIDDHWAIWDARFFADVRLADDLKLGERVLADSVGFSAEWQLFRLGERESDLGELFLDVQGLLGSNWLDVRVGRFQLPVGESYLRFSRGSRDNPFVTNAVSGPWWWDEGVRIHGEDERGRFGYTAAITAGETRREWSTRQGELVSLKVFARPAPWLYLSASGLYAGSMGEPGRPGEAALWVGETWGQGIPNGKLPFPGAELLGVQELDDTRYLGGDAILTHPAGARLWLAYGSYEIDSAGPRAFDRTLHGWIAELVLEGRLAAPNLHPVYLALRANGLGTYDAEDGYVLDFRYGDAFGPMLRALEAYSIAAGWRLGGSAVLKLEYTFQDVAFVRGARALGLRVDDDDFLLVALGLHF